jgi:hypothetical protein
MVFSSLVSALDYAVRHFGSRVWPSSDSSRHTVGWYSETPCFRFRVDIDIDNCKSSHLKDWYSLTDELSTLEGRRRIARHIESCPECIVGMVMES